MFHTVMWAKCPFGDGPEMGVKYLFKTHGLVSIVSMRSGTCGCPWRFGIWWFPRWSWNDQPGYACGPGGPVRSDRWSCQHPRMVLE